MAEYFGALKDSDYFGEYFSSSSTPPISSVGYFGELKGSDYFGEFFSSPGSGGLPRYISVTEGAHPVDSSSALTTPSGVVWPYQLPVYIESRAFSYSLSSSSLSFKMSTGYDKRRKKFTGQYATYSISMIMSIEEVAIFEQFFYNNLGYGVVDFYFPDPFFIDDYILVRFKADREDVPYVVRPYGDTTEFVRVSFTLEELITGYIAVPTTEWPSSLPECVIHNTYKANVQSGLIRDTSAVTGNINVRRRFTAILRKHVVSIIVDRDQLQTFENFYASLGYGSLDFVAPFPIDNSQTMRTRFDSTSGSGYEIAYYNDTDLFEISFILEELPLIKEYT